MIKGFNFLGATLPFQFCLLIGMFPIREVFSQNIKGEPYYTALIYGKEMDTIFTAFNFLPHFRGIQLNDESELLFSFYNDDKGAEYPRMIALISSLSGVNSLDCICSHYWERTTYVPDPEPPYSIVIRNQYLVEFNLDSCTELYHEPFIKH